MRILTLTPMTNTTDGVMVARNTGTRLPGYMTSKRTRSQHESPTLDNDVEGSGSGLIRDNVSTNGGTEEPPGKNRTELLF